MTKRKVVDPDQVEDYFRGQRIKLVVLITACVLVAVAVFVVAIPIEQKRLSGTVILKPVSTPWSIVKILPSRWSAADKRDRIDYVCGMELASGKRVVADCPPDQPYGFSTPPVEIIFSRRLIPSFSSYQVVQSESAASW